MSRFDEKWKKRIHQEIRVFEFFVAEIRLGSDGFQVKEEEKCARTAAASSGIGQWRYTIWGSYGTGVWRQTADFGPGRAKNGGLD